MVEVYVRQYYSPGYTVESGRLLVCKMVASGCMCAVSTTPDFSSSGFPYAHSSATLSVQPATDTTVADSCPEKFCLGTAHTASGLLNVLKRILPCLGDLQIGSQDFVPKVVS